MEPDYPAISRAPGRISTETWRTSVLKSAKISPSIWTIQGLVALDVHRAELTHAHLFEATVRALHHFREQAQHHQARDMANPGVIQDAIGIDCRWCNMKAAAFPVAVAQDKHHGLFIPALSIAPYMQKRRIMI